MNRPSWKYLLIGGVMTVALSLAAPQAKAWGWGWGGGMGGAWGGWYAPYYSGCCSPYYSSYYWPSYSSGGCCGSCGYSYGNSCGSCGYSYGGSYGYSSCSSCYAASAVSTSAATLATTTTGEQPVSTSTASGSFAEDSGTLTVTVPEDATVTVNGLTTRSTGSRRTFTSSGLKPGLHYNYVVHVQAVRNGRAEEATRTVALTVGQTASVAFDLDAKPAEQVAAR